MNHNQRGALGTAVIAFLIVAVFYIPWQVEPSGDLMWAPFYRGPVEVQAQRIEALMGSRYVLLEGTRLWWLHLLQLAGIAGIGYWAFQKLGDG
ncbi:MAG: hypothetical protein JJ896_11855 [Rhodothermales bacterium]|nr:hypothetical protein [Rhodothermales bacterium]MBO6780339.1 hypothetical protein [Rhodothermales bacterium]